MFPDRYLQSIERRITMLEELTTGVVHRQRGVIPGCIMLPDEPPERSLQQMAADTSAFHCRVQAYIAGKLDYERVW